MLFFKVIFLLTFASLYARSGFYRYNAAYLPHFGQAFQRHFERGGGGVDAVVFAAQCLECVGVERVVDGQVARHDVGTIEQRYGRGGCKIVRRLVLVEVADVACVARKVVPKCAKLVRKRDVRW